jgi:hypothetical protein
MGVNKPAFIVFPPIALFWAFTKNFWFTFCFWNVLLEALLPFSVSF